jgi:pyruvate formate lyase activating enzyme
LSLTGRLYSAGELLEICQKDQAFYEESGGGVTLSGGEILAQPEFTETLLVSLGQAGIHRAVETSGYAAPEVIIRIGDNADLILFDIKHYHRASHLGGTGVYNDRILHNLQTLIHRGREILPRIPVIPGYNDRAEDAAAFADLLLSAGIPRVQLLPFHQFGEKKYSMLGMDYSFKNITALREEDLKSYAAAMTRKGISVI